MSTKPKCAHGYTLMQDTCPGCDAMEDTPHAPTIVTVVPSWSSRPHQRCIYCSKTHANPVHTAPLGEER